MLLKSYINIYSCNIMEYYVFGATWVNILGFTYKYSVEYCSIQSNFFLLNYKTIPLARIVIIKKYAYNAHEA